MMVAVVVVAVDAVAVVMTVAVVVVVADSVAVERIRTRGGSRQILRPHPGPDAGPTASGVILDLENICRPR